MPVKAPVKPKPTTKEVKEFVEGQRLEAEKAKKEAPKKTRFLITSPLAQAKRENPEEYNVVGVKETFQIHPAYNVHEVAWDPKTQDFVKTGSGKILVREAQTLILFDGEGFTDDILVAAYLKEMWPGLIIKTNAKFTGEELRQRQELEALKAEIRAMEGGEEEQDFIEEGEI